MIRKILSLTASLLLLSTCLGGMWTFPTFAVQKANDYKIPFRYGELWRVAENGIHSDYTLGLALDFNPIGTSSLEVLSPASGTITRGCTDRDQTYLLLDTGYGDMFTLLHLQKDSVPFQRGVKQFVQRGDYLGKISTNQQYAVSAIGCTLISTGPHLHLGFPNTMCPLNIDSVSFDCNDGANIYQNIRSTNSQNNSFNLYSGQIQYSMNSTLVMTVLGSNPQSQTPIRLQNNIQNLHQKWQYNILNHQIRGLNEKCIDGGDISNPNNRWLRIESCSGGNNQQWYVDNKGRIHSLANLGLCVELQYDYQLIYQLVLAPCGTIEQQKFSLTSSTTRSDAPTPKLRSLEEQTDTI
jgi:hypothetical protein